MINTSPIHRRRGRARTSVQIALFVGLTLSTVAACSNSHADTTTATGAPATAATLTCDGAGVDDAAQIRYRTETFIDAPLSTVWNLQTDVEQWPAWQEPVATIKRLDSGPLAPSSRFRWTTPAPATPTTPATTLVINSTVQQLQPQSCIRWSGPAEGEGLRIDNGVHVWNFAEVDGGVLVSTEESWTGAQAEADVPTSTTYLGAGLDAWLGNLKAAAEALA